MKTLQDFQQLFDQTLKRDIAEFEERRVAIKKKIFGLLKLLGLIFVSMIVGLSVLGASDMPIPDILPVLTGILFISTPFIILVRHFRLYTPFKKEFKEKIVREVLEFIQPGIQYMPDKGIPQNEFKRSGLVLMRTGLGSQKDFRYESSDLVTGELGGIAFHFAIAKVRRKEASDLFNGAFIIVNSSRKLTGETIIKEDLFERYSNTWVGAMLKWIPDLQGQVVRFDDEEFEKQFAVYGTDEAETRQVVSRDMMDWLMQMNLNRGLRLSFQEDKVYATLHYKREELILEPNIMGPPLSFDTLKGFLEYFVTVLSIVEKSSRF